MKTSCRFLSAVCLVIATTILLPISSFAAAAPSITTQPQSQSAVAGSNAVFTVVASGQTPLSYEWSFNGTNLTNSAHISGATSDTLTINNVVAGDAGNYQVMVSNNHGRITSSNAILTVLIPVAIATQPTNQSISLGSNVTFTIAATGDAPLAYQWYFNGAPLTDEGRITGSTTASLTVSDVQLTDAGGYFVTVTNAYGTATSMTAALTTVPVTHYVSLDSRNPTPPFTDWSTAAANIQDAIDVATPGDVILVTNGVYNSGGRLVYGSLLNRVAINKAVTVQSVNGPAVTTIQGYLFIGDSAVRCVYMTNNANLIGFTLTWGATRSAGDSYLEQSGGGIWCESTSAVISNCVITGNSAYLSGGGVINGTLFHCTISGNAANKIGGESMSGIGGGALYSVLNSCTISGNSAFDGGGVAYGTLNDCTVSGNAATAPFNSGNYFLTGGGGVYNGVANNCKILGNSAYVGGGFFGFGGYTSPDGELNNCLVASNFVNLAFGGIGGTYDGTLNNCTIVDNSGGQVAGVLGGALNNCIIYYNGGSNYSSTAMNNCCTTPMPTNGVGDFTNAPMFVMPTAEFHLLPGSPCIDAGNNAYVTGTVDLDGNPRIVGGTVDVGAYEYQDLPIFVIAEPMSQSNTIGQTVSFNVIATSPASLNYQWQFNGTNLVGATNSSLTLTNIQLTDAGFYSVILSNALATLTSSDALLSVGYPSPTVLSSPASATVFVGSSATFSASIQSYLPVSYQWYFNGTPLTDGGQVGGSTTTNLTLAAVQTTNAGSYWLVATNASGRAASAAATLTVLPLTLAAIQPQSLTTNGGATVTFSASAAGQGPFSYQWQFNGTNLIGATNNVLALTNVLDSQSGEYGLVVSNAAGIVVASNATLTVVPWITISVSPTTVLSGAGTLTVFYFNVGGLSSPLNYQWTHNGSPWDGPNPGGALEIIDPPASWAGTYNVTASDPYTTLTSSNVTLTIIPLTITNQPQDRGIWVGGTAQLEVSVIGAAPIGYQWQFNGTNLPGANTNPLVLTNVQPKQFGPYDVVVTNAYTNLVSGIGTLSRSQVAVWGSGAYGETNLPPGLTNVIAISGALAGASTMDCMALRSNGTVIIWPSSPTPSQLAGVTNLIAVACGLPNFGLRPDGTVIEWFTDGPLPVQGLTNIVEMSAVNYINYLALTTDGTLLTPPYGSGSPQWATNVVAVAEGQQHSLILRADGTVAAWGNNSYGQTNVPPGLSNVVAIAAGAYHSLVLKGDGTVVAWGLNVYGQTNVPTGLSNVVAIAAGGFHNLALKANGTVVAWGLNTYGQTNVPPGLTNVIAIAAGEYTSMARIGNGPPVTQALATTPNLGTNGFTLSLPTQSGRVYVLQYKNSLSDTNWVSFPLVPGNGSILLLTDPSAANSKRFYRVQRW